MTPEIADAREIWNTATGTATTGAENATATAIETATGGTRGTSALAARLSAEHDRRCGTFEIGIGIETGLPELMWTEHGATLETAVLRLQARHPRTHSSA